MTRFARAKGSKASNERLPEEATEWHVMKQQLLESRNKTEHPPEAGSSTEGNVSRKPDAEKNEKNIQWSDFPDTKPMKVSEGIQPSKQKKKKRVKTESLQDEATDEQSKKPEIQAADCKTEKKNKQKKKKRVKKESLKDEATEEECKQPEIEVAECKTEKESKKKKAGKRRKLEEEQNTETDSQEAKKPNDKFKNNKKKFKGADFKRRKPESTENFIGIHGSTIQTMYFDRFPVLLEDGLRLIQLRKDLIKKGVPRSSVEVTIKLERRRAEKALSKEKNKVCFNCRQSGHNISDCPALKDGPNQELTATGICFKCGSTQHIAAQCKVTKGDSFQFATCFICKEVGHISRQCPDNNRGIYPRGGSCNNCGDVTHLRINCPLLQAERQENTIFAQVINDDVESLGNENKKVVKAPPISQTKHVRF